MKTGVLIRLRGICGSLFALNDLRAIFTAWFPQFRLPLDLSKEYLSRLHRRQDDIFSGLRQRPDTSSARLNEALPDQVLPGPVNLVIETLLPGLEYFVPQIVRHLFNFSDSVECLSWGS